MELPNFLQRIIEWVRAGYPQGVPRVDYVPLFALLGSHLTEEEVESVADELALTGDADSAAEIRAAIARVIREKPLDVDIARVRSRLAAGGWPLAQVDREHS